ncbi:MAG: glutamate--tRNA ligase [Verrucomicrobia bacterium]|nr:glutamate--tRNA ligase [Verrucomicrobiota bacterium]
MNVRVRFAPSPTGYLHIGGARTALFNWLFARHTGGKFILRIEDTDLARNTQEAVEVILNGLRWLGLDWDEGPTTGNADDPSRGDAGPYFQSRRMERYRRRVEELRDKGLAYERDGTIRFRMTREPVTIADEVVGTVRRELTDREALDPDFVIVRSDGQPVFHLVNVVDDLEMGITHVIRGEDHLSNTAKHLELFRAFGAPPPRYAHIPLILNPDGSKMSKRDQGASLSGYLEQGYVPAAVVNYLCLLGWSPKDDRQLLPMGEVIERFDLPQILRANARFDMTKLQWLNFEYIKRLDPAAFRAHALPVLERAGIHAGRYPVEYIDAALATCREKIKVFADLPPFADFYFQDEFGYEPGAAGKEFIPVNRPRVARLREGLAGLEPFDAARVQELFKAVAGELGVKVGVLVHPARLACTGRAVGPSLYHLIEVLGRERVVARLDRALAQGFESNG